MQGFDETKVKGNSVTEMFSRKAALDMIATVNKLASHFKAKLITWHYQIEKLKAGKAGPSNKTAEMGKVSFKSACFVCMFNVLDVNRVSRGL